MDPKTNFKLIILQTELERFKFLVRSFLRARLAKVLPLLPMVYHRTTLLHQLTSLKIDAHPLHYQTHELSYSLLSPSETQYLQAHQSLLTTHYQTSFLSQFPQSLQRLDDTAGGISMIDRPDAEKAVFMRVLKDCGTVNVEGTDVRCEFRKGDVWVLRWNAVKDKVEQGDVELI
jgi:GINS complex subunit 4